MLDLAIICGYLLLTLFIGIQSGRKIHSLEQFATADRNYNFLTITATLFATFIGGASTLGTAEKVFSIGLVYIFIMRGCSIQHILVGTIIAPRMKKFGNVISVGDMMEQLYDQNARIITGIASVLLCAGIVGAQVSAIGYVFNIFLGIPLLYGSLIGCGIVLIYSGYGGIRAIVITDILQFSTLIIAIPVVLYLGIKEIGGIDNLIDIVPTSHISPFGNLSIWKVSTLFLALLFGDMLIPPYMQRLFIARNNEQTAQGTLWSGILSLFFYSIVGWIGLVALALAPNIEPNLALPYLINSILPAGIKGFAIAGIIAVIMSSADSYLNAAGISFVQDILLPISNRDFAERTKLSIIRYTTIIIGLIAMFFAICFDNIINLMLYAFNFWAPVILVPLVAGILGWYSPPKCFLFAALSGFTTVLIWNQLLETRTDIEGLIPGIFVNLIVFYCFRKYYNSVESKNRIPALYRPSS